MGFQRTQTKTTMIIGWWKNVFSHTKKPTPQQPTEKTCSTCKYAHPDRGCELNVLTTMTHIVLKRKRTCLDYECYVK